MVTLAGVLSRSVAFYSMSIWRVPLAFKALFAMVLLSTCSSVAATASQVCDNAKALVTNSSQADFETICKAVQRASELLSNCGIRQRRDIDIVVTDRPQKSERLDLYGAYDPRSAVVRILPFAAYEARVVRGGQYARLPPQETYEGVVAHEIAHAIAFQNVTGQIDRVAHEYIAYAIQLSSVTARVRKALIEASHEPVPPDLTHLNDMLLYMEPESFSVRAYLHFARPENGCHMLRLILLGRAGFPILE